MSGICGICEPGEELSRAALDAMLGALSLSVQVDTQRNTGRSIALGAARRWDAQEVGAIENVHLAGDTDLTNWPDLRTYLESKDIPASPLSRSEVLAWLYFLDGPDFLRRLEGAFSIALWDEKSQQLLLACDPLGIKTMYFRHSGDCIFFASRASAVIAVGPQNAEVNPSAIMQYLLFSGVTAPLSIFRGVERLQPGFFLTFKNSELRQSCYWDLKYIESANRDEKYWSSRLREEMRAAVHRHLAECDTESTGAYLSGGTDSSSVVAFMSERFKQVHSCSISFPVTGYNEIEYARETARHFQSRHHELCLSPQDAMDAIPRIIEYYDEPFANSSALASYHCALLAKRNGIDTLLAGDGGDELFAGNERYATDKRFSIYQSVPKWLRHGIIEPLVSLLPSNGSALSLPRRYIRRANIPNPRRLFSYNVFLSTEPADIFEQDFLHQAPPNTWMQIAEAHFNDAQASSELNRMMHLDLKMILADNDLRKVSGTAEIAGVRVRYPLLDRRLAEFSGTIPTKLKLKGSQKRYIFKEAMRGILPEKVLFKKKHGFGVPIGNWFLQDSGLRALAQEVLNDPRTRQRGYFRAGFYDQVLDLHRRDHAAFYGEIIWYFIALELWHRQHLDNLVSRSVRAD
ncbi:MAG: asparagine synthase-related protein [Candidatus Acidiferrum sp.]